MEYKHTKELLFKELYRLGGIVFARYMANQDAKAKKSAEAMEFLEEMLEGKIKDSDKEYLTPYLEPLWEVNRVLKMLEKLEREGNKK